MRGRSRAVLARLVAALFTATAFSAAAGAAPETMAPSAGGTAPAGTPPRWVIVVCAPGYPGNTVQAQPTMDAFASAAGAAAGFAPGLLGAVYHEKEQDGLARLAAADAAFALVPLPFYLKHGEALGMKARLQVEREAGTAERWSLAAAKGRLTSPASLAGWEIVGQPGYAPAFVRGPILGGWGALPPTAKITFTPGVLSGLRKALAGEPIAVLLDAAAAASLPALPNGNDLEIVASSKPLPGTLLATLGARMPAPEAEKLLKALGRLDATPEGTEVLGTMQMKRFVPPDAGALETAARLYKGASLGEAPSPREATQEEHALFTNHLRAHFDDIHDVSMRFHADRPSIGGTVTVAMTWRDGRLAGAEVEANDTGCPDEGPALIDAMRGWTIEGLKEPVRLRIPFRIRLVGSDDPHFPHAAIVTGSVRDAAGRPLHRARIEFVPRGADGAKVPAAHTNREGIFVRTLIPPGSWDLICTAEGHRKAAPRNVTLSAGQHRKEEFVLAHSEGGPNAGQRTQEETRSP